MEKLHYVAALERCLNGGFGVFFPDLPGCVSAGESAEQAMCEARDALALHIEGMIEAGLEVPKASSIHNWSEEDFPGLHIETLFWVPVETSEAAPKNSAD